jgi:hypothetical protein
MVNGKNYQSIVSSGANIKYFIILRPNKKTKKKTKKSIKFNTINSSHYEIQAATTRAHSIRLPPSGRYSLQSAPPEDI